MTQLIDTIDSKKLYADRALKDANGKQIDTTYAEAPVILRYGDTVTQTNEELTKLFKQGRLYVLYDDTQLLMCKAVNFGNAFAFIDETSTNYEVNQIFYNTGTSQWYQNTYNTYRVSTRLKNGATGYLSDVLKAGTGIGLEFDSSNRMVISSSNYRIGIVVNQTPNYTINEIIGRFYSDSTYAFDPTSTPIRTFAQVKAYPSENKVVYGRTDGTTRQEYTLIYADETFTWTYDEYELQTKLTFDATPTADSSNPVTSSGIKTALHANQNDISDIIPTDASATNQLASKAYADAIGERLEARYLGSDAAGNPFVTHAALKDATEYFYQGQAVTPDTNDITTVTADEDHVNESGVACVTRYRWNGSGWAFEYVINNTGLNESQLLAVDSGITSAKVALYDAYADEIADAGKNVILTYGQTPTQTWDELIALQQHGKLFFRNSNDIALAYLSSSSEITAIFNLAEWNVVRTLKSDLTWYNYAIAIQRHLTAGSGIDIQNSNIISYVNPYLKHVSIPATIPGSIVLFAEANYLHMSEIVVNDASQNAFMQLKWYYMYSANNAKNAIESTEPRSERRKLVVVEYDSKVYFGIAGIGSDYTSAVTGYINSFDVAPNVLTEQITITPDQVTKWCWPTTSPYATSSSDTAIEGPTA